MEQNSPFETFELQFTQQAQSFYKEASKWAYFLGIMGFVATGFMVLVAILMFTMGSLLGSAMGAAAGMFSGGLFGGIYFIFAALNFFAAYYLFNFGAKAKRAFRDNDTATLTASFENMKSYYKYVGILTVIVIGIYALIFVIAFLGGLASKF